MPIEYLNNHTHNAGWLHRDWSYSTDRSVDLALEKLNAVSHDGLTADEVLEFIKSAVDFGQVTDREARQLSAALRRHYDQMSPEAKKIAEQLDATLQARVPELHDASDEKLSGYMHEPGWFGLNLRTNDPDQVVLEGDELNSFVANLEHIAHPQPLRQAVDFDPNRFIEKPIVLLRG